jgi:hypothetical protein
MTEHDWCQFKDPTPVGSLTYNRGTHITKAAVRVGQIVYLGWRHAEIMGYLHRKLVCKHVTMEMQGFIEKLGYFHNRIQAGKIAYGARQLKPGERPHPAGMLSEHLWDDNGVFHVPKSEWRL